MNWAEWLVLGAGIYVAIGLLWGIYFGVRGVNFVDPVAATSNRGFRIMVVPGAALLWPVTLAWRIRALRREGES